MVLKKVAQLSQRIAHLVWRRLVARRQVVLELKPIARGIVLICMNESAPFGMVIIVRCMVRMGVDRMPMSSTVPDVSPNWQKSPKRIG